MVEIRRPGPSKSDPWIQTFTGKVFSFGEINPAQIDVLDIAHGLSLNCRFNGHCRQFYSVAQHSVLVSELVSPENALWGLMHDAAESYLGDITRPVKRMVPAFKEIELKILKAIAQKFNLPERIPDEVHDADNRMLATEASQLMADFKLGEYGLTDPVKNLEIVPWPWEKAKQLFLERANVLFRLNGLPLLAGIE